MAERDGLINEYLSKLTETERPDLILASMIHTLFNYQMVQRDWPQLGRLVKIYGRWRMLEAVLKASNNTNFDMNGANAWGYFNAICMGILDDEKASDQSVFKAKKEKEETLELIESLKKRPAKIRLKDKTWLTSHRD